MHPKLSLGFFLFFALFVTCASRYGLGAELVTLSPETWDEFVPHGKEVDCIYGDYVLRNDQIVMVVARPVKGRNANMTVRDAGGMLIDLTRREPQSDQLSAFYAGAGSPRLDPAQKTVILDDGPGGTGSAGHEGVLDEPIRGRQVGIEFLAREQEGAPGTTVAYELTDDKPYVEVTTRYENTGSSVITVPLRDSIRADRTFAFGTDENASLFWAYDEWFGQAYGCVVPGYRPHHSGDRAIAIEYAKEGGTSVDLQPGESFTLRRYIFPGDDLLHVRSVANRLADPPSRPVSVKVHDAAGPVHGAKVTVRAGDNVYGSGRTPPSGVLSFDLPGGEYDVQVEAMGRPTRSAKVDAGGAVSLDIELEPCGYVAAHISDADGGPIPCKVAFYGTDGTESPFFGPDTGAVAVQNLYYSHNGRFRQQVGPGKYDVVVSYGPEYDAVFTQIEVQRGRETKLEAALIRTVDTPGWISGDFHSHSTPSGDNTSMQIGRVLNLLCEHVEFAPCTEHNRLSTYTPHLKKLGVERLMATCVGMELTGSPGSVNHQNAFPLIRKPRTQDAGAPLPDENPVAQIERLALWDGGSDKLVQTNHPTIPQILGDRDEDTKPDGGFEKMFGFMDVIEVHPPAGIFTRPVSLQDSYQNRNAIFHWMQLLNIGYRIPGVVNTDAHYNFHGSGGLRNYIKSPTDDPARIETMDMVHAAEAGHIVMSNGPFMEVSLRSLTEDAAAGPTPTAIPGDEIVVSGGKAELHVRVQCANWLDVNRVQVFLNGRPDEKLNFTRRTTPAHFRSGVVKFDATFELDLPTDTHVIVASAGEGLKLGRVMGPVWGENMPVAVANPIFVDTNGDGFQPNHDPLGFALPTVSR